MKVTEKKMANDQAYEARGVVARFDPMGHFQSGVMLRVPVYRFLTLYRGAGREAIPVEYHRPAPYTRDESGELFLNLAALQEGDFVVSPALVYRKCLWFDALMAAHMKALQSYRPKDIIQADKPEEGESAINLGTMDFTKDQVSKQ